MPSETDTIVITGANGHLGQALLQSWQGRRMRALVRSASAADALRKLPYHQPPEIHVVDYHDAQALENAANGCRYWIHLVGILKETRRSRYVDAHERSAEQVARAATAAGIRRIVCLSILGASPDSPNACLASKGRADEILIHSGVPTIVLRVPMVLGPNELAANALRQHAKARVALLVRGGRSVDQPLDIRDVIASIRAACDLHDEKNHILELAGPDALPHRALLQQVVQKLGSHMPFIVPIPYLLASVLSRLLEKWSADPPLTHAMLEVLSQDDHIDPRPALKTLGISLHRLEETLDYTFARDKV